MTAAARKQRERDKRRAAGLVRIEVWVPAAAVAAVRDLVWREFDETGTERLNPANIPDINR